jgi:cardiolipin synthase
VATALNAPGAPAKESVVLLDGGAEAFPRALSAIAAARHSIHLEVYTFERDGIGAKFLDALSLAARRGVRIKVILDGWGSALDGRFIAAVLGAAGCDVSIYNPIYALFVGRFRRNHRKILVVDDEVAILGGINIADDYMTNSKRQGWADLAVEIRGPAPAALGRRLRGEASGDLADSPAGTGAVRIYLSDRRGGKRLRKLYLRVVGSARQHVWLAHAYFLPDRRFVRALVGAARRGIDVSLLLAGRSDVLFAHAATMRLYHQLLRGGVKIFEWDKSVLHVKAAVVDGRRFLVGSFNLDPLSLSNLEALVEVDDPEFAQKGEAWITERFRASRQVLQRDIARTPIQSFFLDAIGLAAARLAQAVGRLLAR